MMTLKTLRQLQDARRAVQLDDGRIGKIVRVDTTFPENRTLVSVFMLPASGEVSFDDAPTSNVDGSAGESDPRGTGRADRRLEQGPGIAKVSLDRISEIPEPARKPSGR